MRTFISVFILLQIALTSFGQNEIEKIANSIVKEGTVLFKSEMASWYGTDIFLEKYQKKENIGGYFSYSDNDSIKCIFFSKKGDPKVIGTIGFDSTFNVKTAKVNLNERLFSNYEFILYEIRSKALKEINKNKFFELYQNTNFNLIPLISEDSKKVYVLSGPKQNGIVIFGNDYLLTFNKKNKLQEKKRLHKNLIPINIQTKEIEGKEILGTMHSHLPETGEFITPTDICTLMLYEKYTTWQQHIVISEEYVSIWDCKKDKLTIMPRSEWNKISEKSK